MNIPPWMGKIFRFTMFRLRENVFMKLPSPCPPARLPACPPPPLGMIWSLVTPSRTTFLCKSVQKSFSGHEKHFLEKSPPIGEEWGEDTMLSKLTSLSSLKMAFSQLSQDITTYIMHCVYKFNLYFFQNILNDILVNI